MMSLDGTTEEMYFLQLNNVLKLTSNSSTKSGYYHLRVYTNDNVLSSSFVLK